MWKPFEILAGRWRKQPRRGTEVYPRLMMLGRQQGGKKRPVVRPTPANLRYFSRTPYARRAINTIKNPIAQLGWEIRPVKGVTLNSDLQQKIDTLTFCFDHPNQDDSFRTLLEQVIEDYLVVSAGAIEQQIGGDLTRPIWLWPVDGQSIHVFPDWSGKPNEAKYIQILGYGNIGLEQGTPLLNDELIYLRPNPNTASPYGYGPLEIAFRTISRKLGVDEYAGNLATNAQPKDMLFFEGADTTFIQALRQYWINEIEGQGQVPIVGGNGKGSVIKLHGGGDDELFLQYQEFLIRELAAAFDISPQNLGVERDVNRSTGEVSEGRDWDQAIKPMASLIQQHLTREVVHAKLGYYSLEFTFVGLDREDEQATAEIYEIYYQNNLITPNEHREKLGLAPSDDPISDKLYAEVQSAAKAVDGPGPKPKRKPKSTKTED